MIKQLISLCSLSVLALTACTQDSATNRTIGTVSGAVAGGVIGSQFGGGSGKKAATIAGTLIGALAGSQIADRLSHNDRAYSNDALVKGLNSGRPQNWRNPETGNYGNFYPETLVRSNTGRYCRPYSQTIYVNGQPQSATGRACRKPDNTWEIIR